MQLATILTNCFILHSAQVQWLIFGKAQMLCDKILTMLFISVSAIIGYYFLLQRVLEKIIYIFIFCIIYVRCSFVVKKYYYWVINFRVLPISDNVNSANQEAHYIFSLQMMTDKSKFHRPKLCLFQFFSSFKSVVSSQCNSCMACLFLISFFLNPFIFCFSQPLLPAPCTPEDAISLVQKKYSGNPDLKSIGPILIAKTLVQTCFNHFQPIIKEKAQKVCQEIITSFQW